MRSVSSDFVLAMHEKLVEGAKKGYKGWQSYWEESSVEGMGLHFLLNRLEDEYFELQEKIMSALYSEPPKEIDKEAIRHEAADIANIAMMIADMAGALNDVADSATPEPPPVEGDTVTYG